MFELELGVFSRYCCTAFLLHNHFRSILCAVSLIPFISSYSCHAYDFFCSFFCFRMSKVDTVVPGLDASDCSINPWGFLSNNDPISIFTSSCDLCRWRPHILFPCTEWSFNPLSNCYVVKSRTSLGSLDKADSKDDSSVMNHSSSLTIADYSSLSKPVSSLDTVEFVMDTVGSSSNSADMSNNISTNVDIVAMVDL